MTGNRCRLLPLILLLLALRPSLPAWAASPLPSDFAYGCPLPVTDETGLYALELPLRVYQKLQQNDQGDLQVFNGAGQPVPQVLRRHAAPQESVRRPVPFFPLSGTAQTPVDDDLFIRVERHSDGSIITVKNDTGSVATNQGKAYLLDLSGTDAAPTELELSWRQNPVNELINLRVSTSSDLAHWYTVHDQAILAELSYNGGTISQRSVALPGTIRPYLRIDCWDCSQPLDLTAVTAVSGPISRRDQWQWQQLSSEQVSQEQGWWRIEYHNGARFLVTALDLTFPLPNSLARVVIESRPTKEAPWRRIGGGDFYRLDLQDKGGNSPFLSCRANSDAYWRLSFAQSPSLSTKEQLPRLNLGWQADELVFLGRGPGPYTLAFGSSKILETNAGQDALVLTALHQNANNSHLNRLSPGPITQLAGKQALRPQAALIPWQRILLWLVLVAGVGLLAMMARSVYREMQQKNTEPP